LKESATANCKPRRFLWVLDERPLLLFPRSPLRLALHGSPPRGESKGGAAFEALERTFTDEQRKLFLTYEAAHNAAAGIGEDAYARQTFLLAREIYR